MVSTAKELIKMRQPPFNSSHIYTTHRAQFTKWTCFINRVYSTAWRVQMALASSFANSSRCGQFGRWKIIEVRQNEVWGIPSFAWGIAWKLSRKPLLERSYVTNSSIVWQPQWSLAWAKAPSNVHFSLILSGPGFKEKDNRWYIDNRRFEAPYVKKELGYRVSNLYRLVKYCFSFPV